MFGQEPCSSVYNPPMNKRPRPEDLKIILLLFLWLDELAREYNMIHFTVHANQAGSNMSGKKKSFGSEDTWHPMTAMREHIRDDHTRHSV